MLNETFILQRIEPLLNAKRELSEFEFMELFSSNDHPLTLREQYEVINLMIAHGIEYVDEKDEETAALNQVQQSQVNIFQQDFQCLMKLNNEQLCAMAQKNDMAALAALLEKNRRFVYQKALKLRRQFTNVCLTIDDLVQEGMIGMMVAAKRFDPNLEFSFLTYAWSWIRQKMEHSLIETGFLIRIPAHMYEQISRVNRYRRDHPVANIDDLLRLAAMDGCVYSQEKIMQILRYNEHYLNTASLNSLVGNDETELIELLAETDSASLEEVVEANMLQEDLCAVLSTLRPKESNVIRLRFGLAGRPHTLKEVGKEHNLTKERIRQIETKALRKMRCPKLKGYLNVGDTCHG